MNQDLISVLAEVFNLPPEQIVPELSKDDVDSWDSLKQMDMVVSIEKKFNITLEITDIVRMNSVENINRILQERGIQD